MTALAPDEALVARLCAEASTRHGPVNQIVTELVDRFAPLAPDGQRHRLIERIVARLDGLDALDHYLLDDTVDEVMVNAGGEVWVDRGGRLTPVDRLPPGAVDVVLERVLAPTGRRLDHVSPIVDVRLPGGSRLCAIAGSVAVDGTTVSIRRHRQRGLALADFCRSPAIEALVACVLSSRCNLLVSGATSSGKTSFVGALLATLPPGERIVVCEDTTELHLSGRHTVRLETRPATADGVPAVDLAALVRAALRLRPDRLVVGEFRGLEALAAVEAMNTGHDGSIATCHANSTVDALRRVETLLMQAAPSWPLAAIRRHVSRSIDVVVHLRRCADGTRRLAEVAEVVESDGEPRTRPLADGNAVRGALERGRHADADAGGQGARR